MADHTEVGVASQRFDWEHKPTYAQMANTANEVAKHKPLTRAEYDDAWSYRTDDGGHFADFEMARMHALGHPKPIYDAWGKVVYCLASVYLRGHRTAVWKQKCDSEMAD